MSPHLSQQATAFRPEEAFTARPASTAAESAEARVVPPAEASLMERIQTRSARIGVIGLGYVGLPLSQALCDKGFGVIGFDIDSAKVESLNAGRSYIRHFADETVAAMREGERFVATADFSQASEADCLLICVPTPLTEHRDPDLSFVEATARSLVPHLRAGQLVVLESTTYPGTTADVMLPILESSGLRSGVDLFVAYSPEREDPGNIDFSTGRIPKVIGGEGEGALRLAEALYGQIVPQVVPVANTRTAEAVKLTENIFRAVNIALVNELKQIYAAMDIDIWEVIEAAKSKPFGYMPFYPGPGLGGHCIPIDPFYLTWTARRYGITTRFIELSGEINTAMPSIVIGRMAEALSAKRAKAINGARVLLLGMSYKSNVDDTRESPSLKIMDLLLNAGAEVDYHDPWVAEIPTTREHPQLSGRRSVPLTAETLSGYDAVLVCTDHADVDYRLIGEHAGLVVDTRNAMARSGADLSNTIKA